MQKPKQAINTSSSTLSNVVIVMFKFIAVIRGHWKATALIAIVAVASLAVVAYATRLFIMPTTMGARTSLTSPPLEFSMELNKMEFQQGENIEIVLSLRNIGSETITLTWFNYYVQDDAVMYFDFQVMYSDGKISYQYTKEHLALGSLLTEALTPDEKLVNIYVWNQKTGYPVQTQVSSGIFNIRGLTRGVALNVDDVSNANPTDAITLETPAVVFVINS